LASLLATSVLSYAPAWGRIAFAQQQTAATSPSVTTPPLAQSEVVSVPVMFKSEHPQEMKITISRPKGQGPFPLVVISHGDSAPRGFEKSSLFFVRKGFVVFLPIRFGNGMGERDEGLSQVLAAIKYGKGLPEVDAKRIVLVGQSFGGYLTVAAVAMNPPGVVAAINFAGGGEDGRGWISKAMSHYAEWGSTAHVPMLWIYTEDDPYFPPYYSEAFAKTFAKSGGKVDFRLLPAGKGHNLIRAGGDIWMPIVDEFLTHFGFQQPGLIQRPQPTNFAAIEEVDKVPYLDATGREDYRKFLKAAVPRAFAISSDGHWGFAQGDDALSRALESCRGSNGATTSKLYAVDSDVVW
jgi:dienelactone hydrolase